MYDKILHAGSADLTNYFNNPKFFLGQIPEAEHYNLYFTVALCGGKRELLKQNYIPFDIDHVDLDRAEETVKTACVALGINFEATLSLCSGYGVQFFVALKEGFEDEAIFDRQREFYRGVCDKLERALKVAGLPGEPDPSVWSAARLMRFPDTMNIKDGREDRKSYVINARSEPVEFDLQTVAGFPKLEKEEFIVKFPPPDNKAILEGCLNIRLMRDKPMEVKEPLWYALASVVGRLSNGRELWHELSSKHSGYDSAEADRKLDQAMKASGPRTCQNFSTLPGSRCSECPYAKTTKSPILITGDDYIKTKEWGFHERGTDANGKPIIGKPNYDDLVKWFEQHNTYVVNEESGGVFVFNGTHYRPFSEFAIRAFAEEWFEVCTNNKANEFKSKILRRNLVATEWFTSTTFRKMNFKNGVLDVATGEFEADHNAGFGFMSLVPYDYNPHATAPLFEKFLSDVTLGDADLAQQLLEFAGYAFSNDDYWEHKVMVLLGEGENGKSIFLDLLKSMVSPESYSVIAMRHIQDPQYLANLEGKLFNVASEAGQDLFRGTEIFKDLAGGGELDVKTVYQKPYRIRNRAKFIFAANKMPPATDDMHGFFRRFSIVPFRAVFHEGDPRRDPHILKKLQTERAGIFNMFYKAYQEMVKRGHLMTASASKKEFQQFKQTTDIVGTWMQESIGIGPIDPAVFTPCKDVYSNYANWCEAQNLKPLTGPAFFESLRHRIPDHEKRRGLKRINGQPARFLVGITLGTTGDF